MNKKPEGIHAVITGAGSGVGACIAEGLAANGIDVVLVGRKKEKLLRTAEAIGQKKGRAHIFPTDVSLVEEVRRTLHFSKEIGTCGILVNAAGVHGEMNRIQESDPRIWIKTMSINVFGPYLTCRYFLKGMLQLGWGRIINITSASSLAEPSGLNSSYPLSKVALNHFTRQLAEEIEGSGVTANVVHPGEVKTPMWEEIKDAAHRLGAEGERYRKWAQLVEETGGDPPEKTLEIILDLLHDNGETNGRFLWIKDGLQPPKAVW
jgi:NAD(P)-dependent dehydrogenase (short-subunit alcohol dehydrogenase family)